MANRATWIGCTALLIVGCTYSTPPADPSPTAEQTPDLKQVTFHVPGMNKTLKIL
jgi:hypothetical protein